jgi:NIPSNAP
MISTRFILTGTCAMAFIVIFFLTKIFASAPADSQPANRVFEIRTYTAADGKLDALLDRFRNHTVKLFEMHGMTSIGYWIPQDEPKSKNTLVYILAHESRDAAKKNWAEFQSDPEWQKVKADSESAGPLVTHIDVVYANPTDFSPLK